MDNKFNIHIRYKTDTNTGYRKNIFDINIYKCSLDSSNMDMI